MLTRRLPASVLCLAVAACTTRATPVAPVPVAATAEALDATTVEVRFTEAIDPASVDFRAMEAFVPFARPAPAIAVEDASASGAVLRVTTSAQVGGVLYALRLGGLRFVGIAEADAPAQVNFVGYGVAPVALVLDTRGFIVPGPIDALVNVDPRTHRASEQLSAVRLMESAVAGVLSATVSARISPGVTFAARAVLASDGTEAAALSTFAVTSSRAVRVALAPRLARVPEFSPPVDDVVGDGVAPVRIVFDDRFARALAMPAFRSSLDASGHFDLATSRVDALSQVPDKGRVYEVVLRVAVDPARRLDGTTPETFPYVGFLVEGGVDVPERGTSFAMPVEMPQVIVVPVGNPALVPVTFRVDVGSAILEPDRSLRGRYPGEGIFLTGEFPNAEDALGRLAADAFSGGERATLEMQERPDAPGIFEKTVFMMKNRPYGWKAVRCPTGVGCAELNRHVASSGRAFPTVMKNLVTANQDAAGAMSVRLIDPARLDRVELEGGAIADYSNARVSLEGTEMPSPAVMFKQEAPDLVVTVGTEPLITPTYVVGTWRDVNIPDRPTEIIRNGGTLNLAPFDYDDGLSGRLPLIRDRALPVDPGMRARPDGEPAFDATDGVLDAPARPLPAMPGRLPLSVAWNGRELYVATSPATAGKDHFVLVSLDPPTTGLPAQWAKAGTSAGGPRAFFLAMEGDGNFQGWFRRGTRGNDDTALSGSGVSVGRGAVLEGTLDPTRAGIGAVGTSIWIAVVAYATPDGGALDAMTQTPAGNGDGAVDAMELMELRLSMIR